MYIRKCYYYFFKASLSLFQGDPLPPSLVDLVLNTPISSIDDLKRILDVESVGKADPKLKRPQLTPVKVW